MKTINIKRLNTKINSVKMKSNFKNFYLHAELFLEEKCAYRKRYYNCKILLIIIIIK